MKNIKGYLYFFFIELCRLEFQVTVICDYGWCGQHCDEDCNIYASDTSNVEITIPGFFESRQTSLMIDCIRGKVILHWVVHQTHN